MLFDLLKAFNYIESSHNSDFSYEKKNYACATCYELLSSLITVARAFPSHAIIHIPLYKIYTLYNLYQGLLFIFYNITA